MNEPARTFTVAVIVGSVSQPSLNRTFAEALEKLAPAAGLEFTEVAIDQLPFFGAHLQTDEHYPEVGREFKRGIDQADGILFVTPEYNRSITGVLKNAIDWASRPVGQNSFPGKPVAVIGTSKGVISTAVAQNHLKAILTSQGAAVLGDPEAYIQFTEDFLDADGGIASESTRKFLSGYLANFFDLIRRSTS